MFTLSTAARHFGKLSLVFVLAMFAACVNEFDDPKLAENTSTTKADLSKYDYFFKVIKPLDKDGRSVSPDADAALQSKIDALSARFEQTLGKSSSRSIDGKSTIEKIAAVGVVVWSDPELQSLVNSIANDGATVIFPDAEMFQDMPNSPKPSQERKIENYKTANVYTYSFNHVGFSETITKNARSIEDDPVEQSENNNFQIDMDPSLVHGYLEATANSAASIPGVVITDDESAGTVIFSINGQDLTLEYEMNISGDDVLTTERAWYSRAKKFWNSLNRGNSHCTRDSVGIFAVAAVYGAYACYADPTLGLCAVTLVFAGLSSYCYN